MRKSILAIVVMGCLLTVLPLVADDGIPSNPNPREKTKAALGTLGENARINVKLKSGITVKGHVSSRGDDNFVVTDQKSGRDTTVAYGDIVKISGERRLGGRIEMDFRSQFPAIKTISLQWRDLAPLVAGHEVEVVLPDGTKLRGDVYAVRDESIVLDVKKTSNERDYPKGQHSLQRSSVSSLNLRNKTIRWRVIATTAGAVGGLIVGSFVAYLTCSPALALTAASALPIGLHLAARPADVQVTRIEINPQSPESTPPQEEK